MSITEISSLPMREKFQIMEMIWDEMRVSLESAEAPRNHRDILDSRRARVDNGDSSLLDWDRVKDSLGHA